MKGFFGSRTWVWESGSLFAAEGDEGKDLIQRLVMLVIFAVNSSMTGLSWN
jgi:hypothetical protein